MRKCLRLSAVGILCVLAARAVDWKTLRPQGYVSDFAGVIDPAARAKLENYAAAVERASGAQMVLVTIPSLEGQPIEAVANTIFRAWGIGRKNQDNGILLLLAIGDRRDRLEVGYGLEPILPDGLDGSILRAMRPALRQRDYCDALMAAAQTIGQTIAQVKHVSLTESLPRRTHESPMDEIPWPLIFGAVFVLFWLMRSGGPRGYSGYSGWRGGGFLPGLFLGGMVGRSTWGSRGSGGFGGFDSGDGFGGFGGGDSGGGGASSDW